MQRDADIRSRLKMKIKFELEASDFASEEELKRFMDELKKPGRDPRAAFERPSFRDDVMSIKDLKENMVLEGKVLFGNGRNALEGQVGIAG